MTAPKRRWFDRTIGNTRVINWTGLMLLIVGGSNAVGASKWAQKTGQAWHPMAWGVFLPMFAIGCALLLWSLRRDRSTH